MVSFDLTRLRQLRQLSQRMSLHPLRDLPRRRILVITDRYPPHAVGGAEVSLHILLRQLENKQDFLVVTFKDGTVVPRRYRHEGIDVVELPQQGRWPYHRLPVSVADSLRTMPTPVARHATTLATRIALRVVGADDDLDAGDLAPELVSSARPAGGVVCDFVEYPHGLAVPLLRAVIDQVRPEILHADNYRSIMIAALASEGTGIRRIGFVRDSRFYCVRHSQSVNVRGRACVKCRLECAVEDAPEAPETQLTLLERSKLLRQRCLASMDRVVVTSEFLRGQVASFVPDDKIVIIPNAPDAYDSVVDTMRGIGERPGTNILVVGMINENKGQLQFAARLRQIIQRIPDAVIHLAGRGGRIEPRIRELCRLDGFSDRVVFHGYVGRTQLYRLYRECQIVAAPTIAPEGFGRVPLEAGLARRPVVAFSVGGLSESIHSDRTGYLVEPGDYDTFIEQLGRLADDPKLRREMGASAFEHVEQTYAAHRLKEPFIRLWNELAQPNQPN